ncbi:MAG: hypothetical protein RR540_03130 [Oscillospiraceae bacterium]
MAKFCEFCGKKLDNGACDCEESVIFAEKNVSEKKTKKERKPFSLNFIGKCFLKPNGLISEISNETGWEFSLIIFALEALLIFFAVAFSEKSLNFAIAATILTIVLFILVTLITFFISRKNNKEIKFITIFVKYSVATVIPVIGFVAAAFVPDISKYLLLLSGAYLMLLGFSGFKSSTKLGKNSSFWLYILLLILISAAIISFQSYIKILI